LTTERDATGIAGLDDILLGGLPHGHLYLLEGEPGTGKTTVAMDFLRAGVAKGEKALYVTLSETEDELRLVADSHNWDVAGIEFIELQRDVAGYATDDQYTVFEPTEVELGDTVSQIYDAVNRIKPLRIVLDSLSELRLLSRDSLRFRREVLSFKRFFADRDVTVLMIDDRTMDLHEGLLQSLAHGVIRLERMTTEYGAERRRLTVSKLRGSRFREGYHDYRVNTGGVEVYPRLVASEHRNAVLPGELLSGIDNLDHLLGGGLDRGTSTMLLGPSGAGKSTISAMYAAAATAKGERVEIYLYDENLGTYLARDRGLGLGLAEHIESGMITIRQIDPAEVSPGEFAAFLRKGVEERGTRYIVIDSLNGLIQAMPGEQTLMIQVHELLSYLNQSSVTTMITLAQHGMMGNGLASAADLSYVADTLIVLRFFEAFGEVRKAISVVKKRTGDHERTLRELHIAAGGLKVGEPLRQFQGIFTGVPQTFDGEGSLFDGSGR
jgi:circadian clock protein KaiC